MNSKLFITILLALMFASCRSYQTTPISKPVPVGTEMLQVLNETSLKIEVIKPTHLFLEIPFSNPYMDAETIEGVGYKVSLKGGIHICANLQMENPERITSINKMAVQYVMTDENGWHYFRYFPPGAYAKSSGSPPI